MDTFEIGAAKSRFAALLRRVEAGETIIITRGGKPVARLAPLLPAPTTPRLGFMKGEMTIPDDFNEMYREEIEAMFNGDAKA